MRQVPALIRALAALFALAACDKLPGFPQRNAAAVKGPSALAMGPWLLDPGASATDRLATEAGPAVADHRVALLSLQPQTQYRYRIEGSESSFVFTTAPEPG